MARVRKKNDSYHAAWREPSGRHRSKCCGRGAAGKRLAERLARKVEAEILLGTYDDKAESKWSEFAEDYEKLVMSGLAGDTYDLDRRALDTFVRIARPRRVRDVSEQLLRRYVAERATERGRMRGEAVSAHTINKELRVIRKALRTACRWGYLQSVPDIPFVRAGVELKPYVSPDEFRTIYRGAIAAKRPELPNVSAETWWKALLVTLYLTGWRISQTLLLEWSQVDFERPALLSKARQNKGRRDVLVDLHPSIAEHLRPLKAVFGSDRVFQWPRSRRALYDQFSRIQEASGLKPATKRKGWYGFHDLRRGFATLQATQLDLFELQRLMQHKSLETTRRYVSMAERNISSKLIVPELDSA